MYLTGPVDHFEIRRLRHLVVWIGLFVHKMDGARHPSRSAKFLWDVGQVFSENIEQYVALNNMLID